MREDLLPSDELGIIMHAIEEATEVIAGVSNLQKAICKLKRFGVIATDPKTNITYDNLQYIINEIKSANNEMKDLNFTIDRLITTIRSNTKNSYKKDVSQ
jgi:hypothetical protein